MTEQVATYKTIQIRTYAAPSGNPVCRTKEGACVFLQARKFGTAWVCGYNSEELLGSITDEGYLRISSDCVLHIAPKTEDDSDMIGLLKE